MAKDRQLHCLLLSALVVLAGPVRAQVGTTDPYRQALLIGVWDYERERDLSPMDVDLQALSSTFTQMNFDRVDMLRNPTQSQIEAAVENAVRVASSVGDDRAVLTVVYFGGHGTMVENTSYLLAKDFKRPADAASIIVRGGIRSDYIGQQLSEIGQPTLLIVEACRNPFVPGQATTEAPGDADEDAVADDQEDDSEPRPMIGLPSNLAGYITLFGQTPGKLVEISARDVASPKPTALVRAFSEFAPKLSSAPALGGAVRDRVMKETQGQRHPMEPHMDARGGEIHLFYDDKWRALDGQLWDEFRASDNAELVRAFLSAYPTSPNAPVAKRWLREREAGVRGRSMEYVAYTASTNAILGRRGGNFWSRITSVVDVGDLETPTGKLSISEVGALRLVPKKGLEYQGRTFDGRSFSISGPLPRRYDVSRVASFWSEDASAIVCDAINIRSGQCSAIEEIAEVALANKPEKVGTLYVAAILDSSVPAAEVLSQMTAIHARLGARGVPEGSVAYRHFFKTELPNAAATVLFKRGDGKGFHLKE